MHDILFGCSEFLIRISRGSGLGQSEIRANSAVAILGKALERSGNFHSQLVER